MSKAFVKMSELGNILDLIKVPKYKIKQGGEARTPSQLVNQILDGIPKSKWENGGLFLDPFCGRGTFILKIVERLMPYHDTKSIIKMIKGIDTDSYCVYTTKVLMAAKLNIDLNDLNDSIICSNFLYWENELKFDVIVGNPPFQEIKKDGKRKDQASNLWSKFWAKSFRVSNDTGVIALISPTSWLSPSADFKGKDKINGKERLWDVFEEYTSFANVVDVKKHFSEGSSFGYVVVDKSSNRGLTFSDGASTALGFLPNSRFAEAQALLSQSGNLGDHFSISQDRGQGLVVSVPLTRSLTPAHIEILIGSTFPSTGNNDPKLYLYVVVPDLITANQVVARITRCLDLLNDSCRWNGFMNIKVFRMIRW